MIDCSLGRGEGFVVGRKNVIVCILLRDNEKFIPTMIKQFENLEKLDYNFSFFIYENDSRDNTVKLVKQWSQNKQNVVLYTEKLDQQPACNTPDCRNPQNTARCEKLAKIRNKVMNIILDMYGNYDYIAIVDSDVFYDNDNVKKMFDTLDNNKEVIMVTPHSIDRNVKPKGHYYDISAYTDNNGEQYDICVYDTCKRCQKDNNPKYKKPRRLKNPRGLEEVHSAFAGFGLVRYEPLRYLQNHWEVLETHRLCEHTGFCKKLRNHGKVVINHDCKMEYI